MYERFTDRARKVMDIAILEAIQFSCHEIGTDHILIGILREGMGVGAKILENISIEYTSVRSKIAMRYSSSPRAFITNTSLNVGAKKAIEYAIAEASRLNHKCVGTEHLLLALIFDSNEPAAKVLVELGVNLNDLRSGILTLLGAQEENDITTVP